MISRSVWTLKTAELGDRHGRRYCMNSRSEKSRIYSTSYQERPRRLKKSRGCYVIIIALYNFDIVSFSLGGSIVRWLVRIASWVHKTKSRGNRRNYIILQGEYRSIILTLKLENFEKMQLCFTRNRECCPWISVFTTSDTTNLSISSTSSIPISLRVSNCLKNYRGDLVAALSKFLRSPGSLGVDSENPKYINESY